MNTTSKCESSTSILHATPLKKRIMKRENSRIDKIVENNTTENMYIDEGLADLKEDPLTDPLLISDREEKDIDTKFTNSDSKPPLRKSVRVHKRITSNYSDNVKRHKLNTEEKHILKELENIEEEELPLSAIKQLASLCIKHVHKVPPQHKVEATGAHNATTEEKSLFQKYGPLRKGPYSPTEDTIIAKNWNTFCKLHNWNSKNTEPFLNWRHNGKYYIRDLRERQKFVQFLANGLPWRTLFSVYTRFKVLYRNKITNTRYSSKEDKKILTYINNKYLDKRGTKYIELAKLLRRTSQSVSKRYRYLKRIQSRSVKELNVNWTLPLIKKFIKKLLNITKIVNVEDLKHATLPMPIWQKMEEELNIDGNVLKVFWQHQLHLQLFSTNPIYLNDIKIQLIEYMYKKGISNTREIIWPNVALYFDGATAVFLCKIFFYLVQECDINDTDNFAHVVEYLYHKKIPEIKGAPTDKFLPRIVYKDGKIDVLSLEDDTNNVDYGADCDSDDD
ncbi:uncharacterized protein LOC116845053 isoform X2 [Odontomachus brunneus]|uniref:uncharacterized protein LOC116845053 isoform X2 n=1 Tax=Odontomachus brunneus TaxID=486640 RepID=UPI0013F1E255|nr:uncharacterized protein LOC116845053 isoform X2 [Odontomachus brunneus]